MGRTDELLNGITDEMMEKVMILYGTDTVLLLFDLERNASAQFCITASLATIEEIKKMRNVPPDGEIPYMLIGRHPKMAAETIRSLPLMTESMLPIRTPRRGCIRIVVFTSTSDGHLECKDFDQTHNQMIVTDGKPQPIIEGQQRTRFN